MYTPTTIYRTARSHWSDDRATVLLVIATGWGLSVGIRIAYPVLLPYLQTAYDLTLSTAGLLLTVLWLAYAVGQLPGGYAGDLIGEGTVMTISMVGAAVSLSLIVLGNSALLLFLGTFAFGFSLALFGTVRLSAASSIYPEKRGSAIGFISAVGDVGNTLIPPVSAFVAAALVWQWGFGFAIPLYVLMAVCLWVFVPSRITDELGGGTSLSLDEVRSVVTELRNPEIVYIWGVQTLGVCVYQAYTGFYPVYLVDIKGMSTTVAAGLLSVFFAFGIVIKPISGNAYDRIGARRTLFSILAVSGIGFLILPFVQGFWALVGTTVLMGFMGGRGTVVLSYMTRSLSDDVLNTGLGTIRTIYMMIGATSPLLFGVLADLGYFDEAFFLLAIAMGLALVLLLQLPDQ